jgi:hypothetical protein
MEFRQAAAIVERRGLLPTTLSSRELRRLDGRLKRRAVFSARVQDVRDLALLQRLTGQIAGGLTDARGVLVSVAEAKAQMREALQARGYLPAEDERGTLRDLSSEARRRLQVETNVLDTMNYGRWVAMQDPVDLDLNPAWELVRMVDPLGEPRDWEARWGDAVAATLQDGATAPGSGRMAALKNHPVWQALGDGAGGYEDTLGNPWPPFAFSSGMGVLDLPRAEAVALGLLNEDTEVPPAEVLPDLNQSLEAGVAQFEDSLLAALESDPELKIEDGVLTLR